jgi:hypothetical protein
VTDAGAFTVRDARGTTVFTSTKATTTLSELMSTSPTSCITSSKQP